MFVHVWPCVSVWLWCCVSCAVSKCCMCVNEGVCVYVCVCACVCVHMCVYAFGLACRSHQANQADPLSELAADQKYTNKCVRMYTCVYIRTHLFVYFWSAASSLRGSAWFA
jgi:hypothetical protein